MGFQASADANHLLEYMYGRLRQDLAPHQFVRVRRISWSVTPTTGGVARPSTTSRSTTGPSSTCWTARRRRRPLSDGDARR
ncbi:hypothetical protein NKG05_19040 [Oerskovia sp. M15]